MATLRSRDSGLPMDTWVDEAQTYQGHAPHIKFRASRDQRTTIEFSIMLITYTTQTEYFPERADIAKEL